MAIETSRRTFLAGIAAVSTKAATASAAANGDSLFPNKAAVEATALPNGTEFFEIEGWAKPGDGGRARYQVVGGEPRHGLKIRSRNGKWGEIVETTLRLEMGGARGNGVANDTAAIRAVTDYGRAKGILKLELFAGKTYTSTNPYTFCNIPLLEIEGNGANLMNPRGGSSKPTTFFTFYDCFAMGSAFVPIGHNDVYGNRGRNFFGTKIKTAVAGSDTIVTADGSDMPNGRVFIYGSDRNVSPSFPPCPACFEYNEVLSSAGGVVTLRYKTKHFYDAQWPEVTNNVTNIYGAARVIALNRLGFTETLRAVFRNINFIENPNFTAADSKYVNGKVTFAGAKTLIVENCWMTHCYVSGVENCEMTDCTIKDVFEPDKCVDTLKLTRVKAAHLVEGIGVKTIIVDDCEVDIDNGLAPIELLHIKGGRWPGHEAGSSRSVFGDVSYGSRKVLIERPIILANSPALDRLHEYHFHSAAISVVDADTISFTRADFNASFFAVAVCVGAIFYTKLGFPAFRVTRMPYCNSDQSTGPVFIDGEFLTALKTSDVLYLPVIPDLEIREPSIEGPYASQITSTLGTAGFTAPYPVMKLRDRYITDNSVRITSDMSDYDRAGHTFFMALGGNFSPTSAVIDVSKPAIHAGAASLALYWRDPGGATQTLFAGVDLKTAGRRTVDRSGIATRGADNTSGSGLGTQYMPVLVWVDNGRALMPPNHAIWSVTIDGKFVGV